MARVVTESALMAALSFLFYIAGYLPFLSGFVLLLAPIPITFVGVRHGGRRALLTALVSSALVFQVLGPPDAYLYMVPFGLLGAITGQLLFVDEEPARMLVIGTGILLVAVTPAALLIEKAMGLEDPVAELQNTLVAVWVTPVSWIPGLSQAAIATASAWLKAQVATVVKLPLAFFFAFTLILFYANHLACFLLFFRLGSPIAPPPDLRRFKTPLAVLLALPVLLLLYPVAGGANGSWLSSVLVNCLLICLFLCYVGGHSAVTRRLDGSSLRPLARVGVSFAMMFPLFFVTIALGMIEPVVQRGTTGSKDDGLSGFR